MKEFNDLVFIKKFNSDDLDKMSKYMDVSKMRTAKQSILEFDNGYSVSVITGYGAYIDLENPYELAVLHKTEGLVYPDFMDNDVKGYLTENDVTKYMKLIQELESI